MNEDLLSEIDHLKQLLSEKINSENSFRVSETEYKTMVQNASEPIFSFNPDETYKYVNDSFARNLGLVPTDIIGRTPHAIFSAEEAEKRLNIVRKVFKTGEKFEIEVKIKKPDGQEICFLTIADPIKDQENNVLWVSCISKNITDQKVKAEESDRFKTQFLLNMSHEIKTPMNAINGFAELLNEPDLSEGKRKSLTAIIIDSSHQLQSIIENILTISALETKIEKANIQAVSINSILADLLAVFKPKAFNNNISLYSKQALTEEQSEIYTDKTKITQILNNLISNAIKFTHEGYVEFGYNFISDADQGELEFYVKDTGIGIKQDLQEKIFERFMQVEFGLTRRYDGNGLGLAISKGFVELLGGKIRLHSEPEKGSTFIFTTPYQPVNDINKTNLFIKRNKQITSILVAEDEEYNFILIEMILKKEDFSLIHARDGQEAVDICKANPDIDIILMDIKMPIMDGHEAAKQIKIFRPDLIIIAQSAYTLEQYLSQYAENPFDDYISKPIMKEALKKTFLKYINNQSESK
jgi:PAS domain S-box-containing protein